MTWGKPIPLSYIALTYFDDLTHNTLIILINSQIFPFISSSWCVRSFQLFTKLLGSCLHAIPTWQHNNPLLTIATLKVPYQLSEGFVSHHSCRLPLSLLDQATLCCMYILTYSFVMWKFMHSQAYDWIPHKVYWNMQLHVYTWPFSAFTHLHIM